MNSNLESVVLVFKTSVLQQKNADRLLTKLLQEFPSHRINFDLEDCDKILRVEGNLVNPSRIVDLLRWSNYQCQLLE